MRKIAMFLMLITLGSKIFGFLRDVVLSYYYGATNITDAYLISSTIPSFMFMFIGTAIVTGFIPVFTQTIKKKSKENGNIFTSNLINNLIVVCTFIVLTLLVFTPNIVKIFASGFDSETLNIAVFFTRVNIFTIYFTLLIYVFKGFLEVKGNYYIPALIGFPLNIIIIVSIIWSAKSNTLSYMAYGYLLAVIAQFLFMVPSIIKAGYKYAFIIDLKDRSLMLFTKIALPTILGVSVNQINVLVDRTFASNIIVGGISSLTYANQINLFIQGVFVLSLITVMYPLISKMASDDNIEGLKKSIVKTINGMNILLIPATIGTIFFAQPIVIFLFGRGAFDSNAITLTASALFFYSLGIIGIGIREVISRVFYSLKDSKTPTVNATIGLIINIILNIILAPILGIGGLALATSISAIITSILLYISIRKKIGSFSLKGLLSTNIKILIASILMVLIIKPIFTVLSEDMFAHNLSLVITILTGILIYFILIYLMKLSDLMILIKLIRNKIKGIG
ncbi:murein biosynthesis integral membrane protein MurJ [Oceanobacillus sp. CAU 1775]